MVIGEDNCIKVDADKEGRMCPDDLGLSKKKK
jgi:hypothetical protein